MNLFNCFLNLSQLLASTTSCGNEFQFNYVLHEKMLPFCEGNYFLKRKKENTKKISPKTINQQLSLCKTPSSRSFVRALEGTTAFSCPHCPSAKVTAQIIRQGCWGKRWSSTSSWPKRAGNLAQIEKQCLPTFLTVVYTCKNPVFQDRICSLLDWEKRSYVLRSILCYTCIILGAAPQCKWS